MLILSATSPMEVNSTRCIYQQKVKEGCYVVGWSIKRFGDTIFGKKEFGFPKFDADGGRCGATYMAPFYVLGLGAGSDGTRERRGVFCLQLLSQNCGNDACLKKPNFQFYWVFLERQYVAKIVF